MLNTSSNPLILPASTIIATPITAPENCCFSSSPSAGIWFWPREWNCYVGETFSRNFKKNLTIQRKNEINLFWVSKIDSKYLSVILH